MKKAVLGALVGMAAGAMAHANDYEPAMRDYVQSQVVGWIADPVLVGAIRAQNARHAGMTQAQIDQMDSQWRAQVGSGEHPLIDDVLQNPASDFLRGQQAASAGVISPSATARCTSSHEAICISSVVRRMLSAA